MKETTTEYLNVPEALWGTPTAFFNPRTSTLLLDGPRGQLLVLYPFPDPPDPERYHFYTTYPVDYKVFDGNQVPRNAIADVGAAAVPVPRSADNRGTVFSGATGMGGGTTAPRPGDINIVPTLPPGLRSTMLNQSGIRVTQTGVEGHFEGGGFAHDAEGSRFVGKNFSLRTTVDKGITRESPLFGMLPKTAVTFWAADYLPDVEKLDKWSRRIAQIITLTNVVVGLHTAYENLVERLDANK